MRFKENYSLHTFTKYCLTDILFPIDRQMHLQGKT